MTPPFEGCDPGRYLEDGERSAPESTPHLVVDLPTVRDNVARVLEVAGGPDGWRPHLKTSKLPEVWTLLLEQGLHRFKCATVLELSELLSIAPEADCVLAHHPDDAACGALGALARAHPRARIACLVSISRIRSSVVAKPDPAVMPRVAAMSLEYTPSTPTLRASRYAANVSRKMATG